MKNSPDNGKAKTFLSRHIPQTLGLWKCPSHRVKDAVSPDRVLIQPSLPPILGWNDCISQCYNCSCFFSAFLHYNFWFCFIFPYVDYDIFKLFTQICNRCNCLYFSIFQPYLYLDFILYSSGNNLWNLEKFLQFNN